MQYDAFARTHLLRFRSCSAYKVSWQGFEGVNNRTNHGMVGCQTAAPLPHIPRDAITQGRTHTRAHPPFVTGVVGDRVDINTRRAHPHSHSPTRAHPPTHTHTHTRTHTRTHAHIHTLPSTHTLECSNAIRMERGVRASPHEGRLYPGGAITLTLLQRWRGGGRYYACFTQNRLVVIAVVSESRYIC